MCVCVATGQQPITPIDTVTVTESVKQTDTASQSAREILEAILLTMASDYESIGA